MFDGFNKLRGGYNSINKSKIIFNKPGLATHLAQEIEDLVRKAIRSSGFRGGK